MLKHCLLALMLASLVYAVTPSAIAQDNGGNDQQAAPAAAPEHGGRGHFDPERRTEMLAKHLNLTSDQQAKVLDIYKSAQSQMESLHSDTSLSQQDRHAKMMDIRKSSDEQVRAVLDANQQKKFDAMQARREQRMEEHQNGQAPPPSSQPQQPQQ
jgi:periplasmic protein CpxP/Spy